MKIAITCSCGAIFYVSQKRLDTGRGKYCSNRCKYEHYTRPSGLKYTLVKENPTTLRAGHTRTPKGEANPQWRGEAIGYKGLHNWVKANKEKPSRCEDCGVSDVPLSWANLSHEYKRDLADWAALCRSCHGLRDRGENWGKATEKYGQRAVQRGH